MVSVGIASERQFQWTQQHMICLRIGERIYMIVINYVSLTIALNVFNWDQLWQLMTD